MAFDRNEDFIILSWLLSDGDLLIKCADILKSDYFHEDNREVVSFILSYAAKYFSPPDILSIQKKVPNYSHYDKLKENITVNSEYAIEEIVRFCKKRATYNFILGAAKALQNKEVIDDYLLSQMEDIVTITVDNDVGLEYPGNVEKRLERFDRTNYVKTGIEEIDKKLEGGFKPGELNIFAGSTGAGKSLFLQNIAVNWFLEGKTVIYYTLELDEDLVSVRIDSMLTGLSLYYVKHNKEDVIYSLKNVLKGRSTGKLFIKYIESGATINDILGHLKNFKKEKKTDKVDAIIIDYIDLMKPATVQVNLGDLFVKDKYVSEEVRSLAKKLNVLCVTASQLNRESISDDDVALNHIAGGISKANTADNVIGIKYMKGSSRYRLFFLKTRNSQAAGDQIDVDFNNQCLRIGYHIDEKLSGTKPHFLANRKTEEKQNLSLKENIEAIKRRGIVNLLKKDVVSLNGDINRKKFSEFEENLEIHRESNHLNGKTVPEENPNGNLSAVEKDHERKSLDIDEIERKTIEVFEKCVDENISSIDDIILEIVGNQRR